MKAENDDMRNSLDNVVREKVIYWVWLLNAF